VRSLYVHVPFCFHKCHYCDFYSIVDTRDRQVPFVERLLAELEAQAPLAAGAALRTIFVGGGTPTLLRPDLWERVLARLEGLFDLAEIRSGAGEFTVECNPETATPELFGILRGGGVNRISVGAQSFNPAHLKTLERWHDPGNVGRALGLARAAGIERRSVDLIFGVPGQTLAEWEDDLRTALGLGVEHVSAYALTYEANTAMTTRLRRGEFTAAPEELEAAMFEATRRIVRGAGLEPYEVSNFALPGRECRHNLAYWRGESWLATGPSASGHVHGVRWKNAPRLDDYLGWSDAGWAAAVDIETPEARRALVERLMTGLRLSEGVDAASMLEAARGLGREAALAAGVRAQAGLGLLHDDGTRWRLTESGIIVADGVVVELIATLD
jgi:oxygen-independent coproporphyrinogen-3 oxidase